MHWLNYYSFLLLKAHQNMQVQLTQQAANISRLSQQVASLNSLLSQVPTTTNGTGSGLTSAAILSLQSQIQQVRNIPSWEGQGLVAYNCCFMCFYFLVINVFQRGQYEPPSRSNGVDKGKLVLQK